MSSFLPEGIIENIFTRLPVKSISRFRCVSKYWYHLFRNPYFIKNHLNHANLINRFNILVTNYGNLQNPGTENDPTSWLPNLYSIENEVLSSASSPFLGHALEIDYPSMSPECVPEILGSSNGLVCIKPINKDICIWNPATREFKHIPEPLPGINPLFIKHGLGFDCKNDDYKVLRVVSLGSHDPVSEARVYSLASNSWKELGVIRYDFSCSRNKGLLLNGVLHWIAIDHRAGLISKVVVCYDISDETFHHVPLPNNCSNEDGYHHISDLGIWEGKLCLLRRNDHIDVWTMIDNKWSKHLKITALVTDRYHGLPVQILKNGEILFQGGGDCLLSYDPILDRAGDLKIHGFPDNESVETYIDTLVALNSGTYVGQ